MKGKRSSNLYNTEVVMSSKFYTFSRITVKPCLTATSEIRLLLSAATVFWPPGNTALHFLVKKTLLRSPVNTANCFGPLVTVLTGFHCICRLDFRRLPGPVFRRMSAGSFSRTAAGNRAYCIWKSLIKSQFTDRITLLNASFWEPKQRGF